MLACVRLCVTSQLSRATLNWDVTDIDSGCCRDTFHGVNTPSWCGAGIEPQTDGPCSIADPKAKFHVFVLKRFAQRRNSAAIVKRLFVGLVRPALEYASLVWDGCLKRDSVALERIQLAVARAVYAVHVVTCQTWKRFVALDGERWHGDAGVRSCQFCGTCCSNVDHQNCVTRCHAQLLSVVITLFVTVLLLPFPSAALSIAKIAFYLLLLPFLILFQPL